MINFEALFQISYGLYIVSSGDKTKGNGFISNTVFQVASDPVRFASCSHKNNYTTELIKSSGHFAVSVLNTEASTDILGRFGYKSGRDVNKLEGMNIKYGLTGVPVILNDTIAYLEFKVVDTYDVGSHYMFIGELVQSEIIDNSKEPMTYLYYRKVKKGLSPKNAPTYIDKSKFMNETVETKAKKYTCTFCAYEYDEASEEIKFADLPDDWTCPTCGAGKEDFFENK